ncbi:MAG TPA: hypothetical protein VFM18_24145 [Methanosarcina sp.]|nr:hypothetical protein [Methanosarcina sp.]
MKKTIATALVVMGVFLMWVSIPLGVGSLMSSWGLLDSFPKASMEGLKTFCIAIETGAILFVAGLSTFFFDQAKIVANAIKPTIH